MDLSGTDALEFLRQTDRLTTGGEDLWSTACAVASALIPCDVVTLNHVNIVAGAAEVVVSPAEWSARMARLRPVTEQYAHQHPLIAHHASGRGAIPLRLDLRTVEGFTDTELYRGYYEPLGLRHQLVMEVPSPESALVVIVLSRTAGAFTDRDEAMLVRLRPHLALACRTISSAGLTEEGAIDAGWVVVTTDPDGRVDWVSEADDSLAFRVGHRLPPECAVLRAPTQRLFGEQVVFDSGATRWFVRAVPGEGSPVLLAQRVTREAPEAQLTPRQLQVLEGVAGGMSNRELAAALDIEEGTVRKHVENVYRLLGVGTRVEATRVFTERLLRSAYRG
ncbi:LuxR C-terminal-related transcriptional regulator [Nocardioides panacisoli]|uniref:helix-turn-helix transcriptional regulator n=1 Tax=Nocardioides panacisoli TaxID=627624 RepID=UPI001C628828|nr:LuxR C-terminal-related transcriptional regulator [Nocardioides panacisoli]QYJ04454.1 LuxR C-terminal-related transcriptional regulator [Nocardioides panacisoli]